MNRPIWTDPEPVSPAIPPLHDDPLLHQLLARRGLESAERAADFLDARPRPAPDCAGLPNMDAAVERLLRALADGEPIAIFGDYDADGVTATALLARGLRAAAHEPALVTTWLPKREQGYGLNAETIDEIADAGASLLIAVDCGSGDHEQVAHARMAGLDVLILDHHQIHGPPVADAIVVSAHLPGGAAYADLSAVGVAFLLIACLAREGCRVDGIDGEPETALLDLVALGTVADMVPLAGMNRALVRDGVVALRRGRRRGLVELCRRAGVDPATVTADQVAFRLAPRLNAAGRMGDPTLALDLLLEDDPLRAARLADALERLNTQRKVEANRLIHEAEGIFAGTDVDARRLVVVHGPGWPSGVLGLVAARLVERFGRPAIVLADDGEVSHGSARSVPGFDIAGALDACRDLLGRFGGHAQAAGVSLPTTALPALEAALAAALDAQGIALPIRPALRLHADLPAERLTLETAFLLDQLQPFGMGNEQPVVRVRDLAVRQYDVIGQDRSHLRLQLGTPRGTVKAVAFGAAARSQELLHHRRIDIAAVLKIDHWGGKPRLDVEVRDYVPAT